MHGYAAVFVISASGRHGDLHSFPTRRSSDLGRSRRGRRTRARAGPPPSGSRARSSRPAARSEEHTSELQSLRHLVCRLLLEKKKKNATITPRDKNMTND